MPTEGTVLLVEADPREHERLSDALEQAGYEVIGCSGPEAPDYTCIGGREGYCPLVERADVVVLDPFLAGDELGVGTTSDQLIGIYAASGRTVVAIGPRGLLGSPSHGYVISLSERPEVGEVIAAVRNAPRAAGLVLRRPLN